MPRFAIVLAVLCAASSPLLADGPSYLQEVLPLLTKQGCNRGVLDIFHASENLHTAAEALHGEEPQLLRPKGQLLVENITPERNGVPN